MLCLLYRNPVDFFMIVTHAKCLTYTRSRWFFFQYLYFELESPASSAVGNILQRLGMMMTVDQQIEELMRSPEFLLGIRRIILLIPRIIPSDIQNILVEGLSLMVGTVMKSSPILSSSPPAFYLILGCSYQPSRYFHWSSVLKETLAELFLKLDGVTLIFCVFWRSCSGCRFFLCTDCH